MKNYKRSFKAAFNGFAVFFKEEFNSRIHLFFTVVTCIAAYFMYFKLWEWVLLLLAISLVWIAELFNTAIELICNRITKEQDPQIAKIKDLSAAAVLAATIFAIFVGLALFIAKTTI